MTFIEKTDKDIHSSDNGIFLPYTLLEISIHPDTNTSSKLVSNIISNDNIINNSFAILRNYEERNNFKYYD